jgi:hypothetical protein
MNKQHILDEIRLTAKANGGIPLGRKRFTEKTGIDDREWFGKYWGRWSDAVQEAGLAPNALRDAYSDEMLLEKLVAFIQELGRFPGNGNIRMKKRSDPSFPNDKVFDAHFGTRLKLRQAVVGYCQTHPGFDDVPPLCGAIPATVETENERTIASTIKGFVYLMRTNTSPGVYQSQLRRMHSSISFLMLFASALASSKVRWRWSKRQSISFTGERT